jgi:hypothetical protein
VGSYLLSVVVMPWIGAKRFPMPRIGAMRLHIQ